MPHYQLSEESAPTLMDSRAAARAFSEHPWWSEWLTGEYQKVLQLQIIPHVIYGTALTIDTLVLSAVPASLAMF